MIRTRFPPQPNGPLHIGHLKAIVKNFEYPDTVCNLRYDDTNPENETDDYIAAIAEDLEWLGYKPDFVSKTSDYYSQLKAFAEVLLEKNLAYVDFSTKEEMATQRHNMTASPYRTASIDVNMKHYHNYLRSDEGAYGCVRIKIDCAHKNTCMRDPTIFRIKAGGMHPTYDFSHPIVDYLEHISNSFCTREFFVRRDLYYFLIHLFQELMSADTPKHEEPVVFEFDRLNIEGVKLSKRYFQRELAEGKITSFDDPSLFTIAGLRSKGHSPEALKYFCHNYVHYVASDGGVIPMHKFEHALREYYDTVAVRRFGIPDAKMLQINVQYTSTNRPNFPDTEDFTSRQITTEKVLYINSDDFKVDANKKYKRLKPNKKIWLRYLEQVQHISHVIVDGVVTSINAVACKPDGTRCSAIQWVCKADAVKIQTIDGAWWWCEGDIRELDIVQLERVGYFRVNAGILYPLLNLKSGYTDPS